MSVKTEKLAAEQRRTKVAALRLDGWTQEAIAAELGVSQGTISKDLVKIEEAWMQSSVRDFDRQRAIEAAKLDDIERKAAIEFERSRHATQKRTKRKRKSTGGTQPGDIDEATVVDEERVGDPRFLQTKLAAIDRRCKLLGLDRPAKIAHTDPTGEHEAATVHVYLPDNGRVAEGELEEIDDDQDESESADLDSAKS